MSQIYVSGPWSFASGVLQVVKSIKVKSRADKVVYSEKGTEYQFSKLASLRLKGMISIEEYEYLKHLIRKENENAQRANGCTY